MYIPEHDAEVQHALRVIAETRKMLELGGNVAGLESLDHSLRIQRYVLLESIRQASAKRWRRLYDHADALEAAEAHLSATVSKPAKERIWSRLVERFLLRALRDRKEI